MARLTAPLLSLGASGSIAKSLVFASWKGIPYARVHVVPANPNTVKQQEVRGVFKTLTEMYKRFPIEARLPFELAVRGVALTARNKHIQANVALLQDAANCDDLVMSIAGGSAIIPITVTAVDGTNGKIACTAVAPAAPPGYTISYISGIATLDGEPGESPTLPTTILDDPTPPYAFQIDVATDDTYQVGILAVWKRDADQRTFCSAAVRSQVDVTGN